MDKRMPGSKKDFKAENTAHFLRKHGRRVLIFSLAAVLLIIGAGILLSLRSGENEDAVIAFLGADTLEDFARLAKDHAGTAPGVLASVLRAQRLYSDGKYDEARAAFEEFLKAHPGHFLCGRALSGAAYCLERKGDFAGAAVLFGKASAVEKNRAWVDDNLLGVARCREQGGDAAGALKLYEDFLSTRADSIWSETVSHKISLLKRKLAGTKS